MPDDFELNYGRLMQRALRGLMAEVLGQVAEHGLPGEHHFYIGIDTTHPGVDMPLWLKERYPREMTVVLQDWFADLAVLGDRFQVTLNFSNQPQTLVIPFAAVTTFIDPSVKFGLKFDEEDGEGEAEFEPGPHEVDGTPRADTLPGAPSGGRDGEDDGDGDGPGGGSGSVVSLDKFRRS